MKKYFLIILCLSSILMNKNCFAQDNTFEVKGLHTVYVEVYGNAFEGYTIGYDYALKLHEKHKLSFNCGFGYVPDLDNFFNFFDFPIATEISYLYGKEHHLELGVGATCNANFWSSKGGFYRADWLTPFRIGYRFQKDDGDLFFKAAATPFIWWNLSSFMPWFGVAVGYTFKSR